MDTVSSKSRPFDDLSERIAGLSPAKRALLKLKLKQAGLGLSQEQIIPRRVNRDSALWFSMVAIQPNGSKPPFFCVPGNLGNVFTDLDDLARHLGPDQPFYGLQDGIQNPSKIEALTDVVASAGEYKWNDGEL